MHYRFTVPAAVAAALLAVSISPVAASTPRSHPAVKKQVVVNVPAGWPKKLAISRVGVLASIESLAMTSPNDVHAPYKWGDVAWYDLGPKPGQLGRSAVFGHLDSTCCPAVFYRLRDLRKGDVVSVTYKNGRSLNFRVMWSGTFLNTKFPSKFVFGRAQERGLSLITCAGVFHRDGTGYDHKLIVYSRLILPNGKLG